MKAGITFVFHFQHQIEDLIDRQDLMDESLTSLKTDLKGVVNETEKIKEILMAIANHYDISVANEDD